MHRVRRPQHLRHDDHRVRARLQRRPQRGARAASPRRPAAGSTTSATPTPTATATPGPGSSARRSPIPLAGAEMMLGVWQRIVCVDFDDRARSRRLVVHLARRLAPRRSAGPSPLGQDLDRGRRSHRTSGTRPTRTCSSSTSTALDLEVTTDAEVAELLRPADDRHVEPGEVAAPRAPVAHRILVALRHRSETTDGPARPG